MHCFIWEFTGWNLGQKLLHPFDNCGEIKHTVYILLAFPLYKQPVNGWVPCLYNTESIVVLLYGVTFGFKVVITSLPFLILSALTFF